MPKIQAFNEFNNIFDQNFYMKKIIGIGNALVDIVTFIDNDDTLRKLSLPKGSMQLVDADRSEKIKNETLCFPRVLSSGGSAANTIHGLGMLGAEAAFIGSTGEDESAIIFENDLKKAGVRTILKHCKSPTGTAVALVTPDGERTFGTHLGAAVEISAEDLSPLLFKDYDILYLEGYLIYNMPLVTEACRLARSNKMTVALDLASYNVVNENKDSFRIIVKEFTDILFANEQEAEAFTGEKPGKAIMSLSGMCKSVVVKTGEKGSLVSDGNKVYSVRPFPVKCIDTTGAGDLYASGFLYGYALGKDPGTCGTYGSLLASRVIEVTGARIPENTWSEIMKTIKSI